MIELLRIFTLSAAGLSGLSAVIGMIDLAIYKYFNERELYPVGSVAEKLISGIGNFAFYAYLVSSIIYIILS